MGAADNKHELVNPASTALLDTLTRADALFKDVKMTREAALDSSLMVLTSKLATQQAQKLQTSFVQLDSTVFREKIASHLRGHAAPVRAASVPHTPSHPHGGPPLTRRAWVLGRRRAGRRRRRGRL